MYAHTYIHAYTRIYIHAHTYTHIYTPAPPYQPPTMSKTFIGGGGGDSLSFDMDKIHFKSLVYMFIFFLGSLNI